MGQEEWGGATEGQEAQLALIGRLAEAHRPIVASGIGLSFQRRGFVLDGCWRSSWCFHSFLAGFYTHFIVLLGRDGKEYNPTFIGCPQDRFEVVDLRSTDPFRFFLHSKFQYH